LIEKSLVLVEDGPRGERWYRLLVTIRQFALERLSATGEQSAVRDRHLRWYLELAEQFDREVRWHRGNSWATRIGWVDRAVWEYPNLRAAWQWALAGDTASVEAGLRIAAALYGFFYTAGYLSDARAWFATLLARDRDREPTRARARALSVAAKLAVQHGRDADALALALEYFSLPEHLKEPPVTGLAMNARSVVALREGDLATARRYVMAAYEQASIAPEAALSLYLPYVAAVAEAEGNLQEAERTYRLALEQGRADDFLLSVAFALTGLARLAHARGDLGGARALYEEALKSLAEMRGLPQMALTQSALGLLSLEQGDRAAACRTLVPSLQLAMRLGHREALVVALEASAALLADASADQSLALRLAGAVQRLRDGARVQPAPAFVDEALGRARTTIDEPRASLLMSDGRGLSGDAAVNLALAALEACATHPLSAPGVTAREREVAVLLARGRSNREIAEALVIGQRTAEMHVSNLLTKLGMSSRSQVAIWAMQNGLLSEVP
jgi:DNA-binding NarL/FixJ family response regulator